VQTDRGALSWFTLQEEITPGRHREIRLSIRVLAALPDQRGESPNSSAFQKTKESDTLSNEEVSWLYGCREERGSSVVTSGKKKPRR